MNFFEHQDDAKKKTRLLVGLMGLAVCSLILITVIFIAVFAYYFQAHATSIHAIQAYNTSFFTHLNQLIQSEQVLWIALAVIVVVCAGSVVKSLELRKGGAFVANSLGGRLLLHDNAKGPERQLLNIVEEMALASGVPVPQVYVLDEISINAFAAGMSQSSAIIGITKGSLESLKRDELQGVIAHEFSHILHGDMRLNMHLIALLHGILMIGLLGELLMHSNHPRIASNSKRGGNKTMLLGLGLFIIGMMGTFFGSLIKSAVSRQREFLADASAVQFTRNPLGIAGALNQIQHHSNYSHLTAGSAAEFSHFYFANGLKSFFSKLFATHPPLDTRISRILPSKVQREELRKNNKINTLHTENVSDGALKKGSHTEGVMGFSSAVNATTSFDSRHAGELKEDALETSKSFISSLPLILYNACHTPFQARAVIYSLLIDKQADVQESQIRHLKSRAHPCTYLEFEKIYSKSLQLPEASKLPLIQLCLPALQSLSPSQATLFKGNIAALIRADKKITLFEWCLSKLVLSCLERPTNTHSRTLNVCKKEIAIVMSYLSKLSGKKQRQASFNRGIYTLWPNKAKLTIEKFSLSELDAALSKMKEIKPLQKPALLKAFKACAEQDGIISTSENHVLYALAAALDCPMPLSKDVLT